MGCAMFWRKTGGSPLTKLTEDRRERNADNNACVRFVKKKASTNINRVINIACE